MAIYQCEFKLIHKSGNENITDIKIDKLSKIFPRGVSWSESDFIYGNVENTCIEIFYDDGKVEEISVRVDVANITSDELDTIVDFISENGLHICKNGKLYEPTVKNVVEIMKKSRAYAFVKNPIKFLDDLSQVYDDSLF